MESVAGDEIDHSHANLKPPEPDPSQFYVFVAHLVPAAAISILSFLGGLYSWFVGSGILTPILLVVTSYFYSTLVGLDWYRDELLPYMRRTLMVQEFEIERFLKYKRIHHIGALIAGYIATGVCQIVWFQVAPLVVAFIEHIGALSDLLYLALFGMIILFLVIMVLFAVIFLQPIDLAFSDIKQLIDFDNDVQKFLRAKAEEEAQKNKENDSVKV